MWQESCVWTLFAMSALRAISELGEGQLLVCGVSTAPLSLTRRLQGPVDLSSIICAKLHTERFRKLTALVSPPLSTLTQGLRNASMKRRPHTGNAVQAGLLQR